MYRLRSIALCALILTTSVSALATDASAQAGSLFLTPQASEVDIDSGFIYGQNSMTAFLVTWANNELIAIYDRTGFAIQQFATGIGEATNAANRGRENKIKVIRVGGQLAVARMHRLGTSTVGGVRIDFFRKVTVGGRQVIVKDTGFAYNAGSNRDNTFVQAPNGDIMMFARDTTAGTPYHRFPSAIRAAEYRLSVGTGGRIVATRGQTALKVTNRDYVREHPYTDGDFIIGTKSSSAAADRKAYIMFRDENYRVHSLIEVTGDRDPAKRFGNLANNVITLAAFGRSIEMIGLNTSPAGKLLCVGGLDLGGSPYRFSSFDMLSKQLTEIRVDNADHDHDSRGDVLPLGDDAVLAMNLTRQGRIEGALINTGANVILGKNLVLSGTANDYVDLAGEASYDMFGNVQFLFVLGASKSLGSLLVWADPF